MELTETFLNFSDGFLSGLVPLQLGSLSLISSVLDGLSCCEDEVACSEFLFEFCLKFAFEFVVWLRFSSGMSSDWFCFAFFSLLTYKH